jgi:hypothetical protein
MGDFDGSRIESIFGNSYVHGHETTTELQVLLGERRNFFPLSNHFQHYDYITVFHITPKMSTHYQSQHL